MQTLPIAWPDLPEGIGVMSTVRAGGISTGPYGVPHVPHAGGLNLGLHVGDDPAVVEQNRQRLRAHLPAEPAWLNQVHGVRVLDLSTAAPTASGITSGLPTAPEADASIATLPGRICTIMTADCLPVLLADVGGKQVGAAHAGWRGLAQGIIGETVAAMRAAGADQITAWLGPAIGPNAFEVGAEVREAFAGLGKDAQAAFVPMPGKAGKFLADLYQLARIELRRYGVTQVSGGGHCTVNEAALFYSFRRDGITGRMASLIWIK